MNSVVACDSMIVPSPSPAYNLLEMAAMAQQVTLRPPTTSSLSSTSFILPTTDWLLGTWHVTHSTLPMWSSKRNVTITYKPLPPTPSTTSQGTTDRLDDIVSYQSLTSDTFKTVNGIDTASGKDTGAWDWRGKGWLKIASSHWEVLGWGELDGGGQWAVTYFAKTMFTPAGIDVYSREKAGLPEEIVQEVKRALGGFEDEVMKKLAAQVFEVKKD